MAGQAVYSDFILRMRDQFTGPLNRASRSTSSFSRSAQGSLQSVSRSFRTLQRVGMLAIAAVTTGRIAQMVNGFAAAGDEIAKTARQLGFGVEALQELRFAAERSGVSSSDLSTALRRMNVSVSEFQRRQGQLYQILRATNPALAQQLSTAESSEEAFTLLTEAMHQETNTARRAAIVQAAFGEAGQKLITMAEGGAEGLAALREEARRYGNIMSQDATAASERFQDAMTNLRGVMMRLKTQALLPLIQSMQPLIERMADYLIANRELISLRIEQTLQRIADFGRRVGNAWNSGLIPAVLAGVAAYRSLMTVAPAVQGVMLAVAAAKSSAAVAGGALKAVLLANPIGAVVLAVAALTAGIVLLIRNWDNLRSRIRRTQGMTIEERQESNQARYGMGGVSDPRAVAARLTYGRPITQSTITENRSTVDVNIGGLPRWSTVRQSGVAPGVTVNTGFGTAGTYERGFRP